MIVRTREGRNQDAKLRDEATILQMQRRKETLRMRKVLMNLVCELESSVVGN